MKGVFTLNCVDISWVNRGLQCSLKGLVSGARNLGRDCEGLPKLTARMLIMTSLSPRVSAAGMACSANFKTFSGVPNSCMTRPALLAYPLTMGFREDARIRRASHTGPNIVRSYLCKNAKF